MLVAALIVVRGGNDAGRVAQRVSAEAGATVKLGDGAVVKFPPGALDRDTTFASTTGHAVKVPGANVLGPAFEISIGRARLRKPAVVTLPVSRRARITGATRSLAVASREGGSTPWIMHPATLSADRRSVRVAVRHFSTMVATGVDTGALTASLLETVGNLEQIVGDFRFKARVICEPEGSLYTVTLSGPDAVRACTTASTQGKPGELRIFNNRAYPQILKLRSLRRSLRLHVSTEGANDASSQFFTWLGNVGVNDTFLPSKGLVRIEVPAGIQSFEFGTEASAGAIATEVVANVVLTTVLGVPHKALTSAADEVVAMYELVDRTTKCASLKVSPGQILNDPTSILGPLGSCLGFIEVATSAGERRLRDLVKITDVMRQLSEDLLSVVRVGRLYVQGVPDAHVGQSVSVERDALLPASDLNGPDLLPRAVRDTVADLQDIAARYPDDPARARDALDRLEPPNGLLYAGAADRDQPQSTRLGAHPDAIAGPRAAAAIGSLVLTPPMLGLCEPIGRLAYVFQGREDQDYYAGLLRQRVKYKDEKARLVARAAAEAAGYTFCVGRDGAWMAFAHDVPRGFATADLADLRDQTTRVEDCASPLSPRRVNPFVPARAECSVVRTARLDSDVKPDRLLVYRVDDRIVARTFLTLKGRGVFDASLEHFADPYTEPTNLTALRDLDGRPGDEALIRTASGAHNLFHAILIVNDDGRPAFARWADDGKVVELVSGAGGVEASSFGCAVRAGRRVLVSGQATSSREDGAGYDYSERVYGWDGSRLRLLDARTRTGHLRPPDLGSLLSDVARNGCRSRDVPELPAARSEAAAEQRCPSPRSGPAQELTVRAMWCSDGGRVVRRLFREHPAASATPLGTTRQFVTTGRTVGVRRRLTCSLRYGRGSGANRGGIELAIRCRDRRGYGMSYTEHQDGA